MAFAVDGAKSVSVPLACTNVDAAPAGPAPPTRPVATAAAANHPNLRVPRKVALLVVVCRRTSRRRRPGASHSSPLATLTGHGPHP